jgi:uncharacterized membrane protein YhhN
MIARHMLSFALTASTTLLVLALLMAERKTSKLGAWIAKPLASLGFVAVACASGAMDSEYGRTVLVALIACALGDVMLIPPGAGAAFLSGMASFALGHAGYLIAFWQRGIDRNAALIGLLAMAAVAVATLRWLGPRLPADMRVPIRVYIAIISAMVALAVGASVAAGSPWMAMGAIAFAVSDLSVARERFVQPGFANLLWGLPLYYAAQLLLAATV